MLNDHTSAENYYLHMPLFSSGIDLLAITISDLILTESIVLKGNTYEVKLNCDIDKRGEHEKIVLMNLKDEEIHLKRLVYLSLSNTTKKDFKKLVYSSLKKKGLMRFKYLVAPNGFRELRNQSVEIRQYSKLILKNEKSEIVELVKTLGSNIYLFNGKIKRRLKDIYPKSINARIQILKFMGVSGLSDTYGDLNLGWGSALGVSTGFSGFSGFSGGGGGSFGGGGAGGSW